MKGKKHPVTMLFKVIPQKHQEEHTNKIEKVKAALDAQLHSRRQQMLNKNEGFLAAGLWTGNKRVEGFMH